MTAPVRVLNPFSHEVVLYANTTIGVAGECLVTSEPLVENEDASEEENLQPVRRIKLSRNVDPKVEYSANSDEIHVPAHLEQLYKDAGPSCNKREKEDVAQLLMRDQAWVSDNGQTPDISTKDPTIKF
ncbi:hypothetical protein FSP39_012082 [Pinctada imbricata]|uniref:Uncharacterized protein n=1 Tax=Pinctada imbricata TaxID=66713 RepID=A0AA89BLX6_PINIB|nr:hypothetical protein FSP39_012082 [Pinctada imbricata]